MAGFAFNGTNRRRIDRRIATNDRRVQSVQGRLVRPDEKIDDPLPVENGRLIDSRRMLRPGILR